MKAKLLVFIFSWLSLNALGQSSSTAEQIATYVDELPGYYVFVSMEFTTPFDLNRDGKVGWSFVQEMDKCARDQQFEFNEAGTGTMYWGQLEKDCLRKGEEAFKWRIRERKVKTETGPVTKYYLIMGDEFDGSSFEITGLVPGILTIKGEFPDGLDSTYEGEMQLRKRKKKK